MQTIGIESVRLAVRINKVSELNELLTRLAQGMTVKVAIEKYEIGEYDCTEGQSLVDDGWAEVFISFAAYSLFKEYQYLEKITETQNHERQI